MIIGTYNEIPLVVDYSLPQDFINVMTDETVIGCGLWKKWSDLVSGYEIGFGYGGVDIRVLYLPRRIKRPKAVGDDVLMRSVTVQDIVRLHKTYDSFISETKEEIDALRDKIKKNLSEMSTPKIFVNCPVELPRGKPISEAEDLDLLMFPRLLETIEVGTKRYEEVSKSRAKQTVKVLSDWFQSLSHELGTQYRYVCICPAPQCANRVEFFSYRSGEQITWADCPKCETCK